MTNANVDSLFLSYEFLHFTVEKKDTIAKYQLLTDKYSLDRYFTVHQLQTIHNTMVTRFNSIKQQRRLALLVIKEITIKPGHYIVISTPMIINNQLIQKFYYFETVLAFKTAWDNFISDFVSRNFPYGGEKNVLELVKYGKCMVDVINGGNQYMIRMQTSIQID